MNLIYIAIAALAGGIIAAVLGWLDSGENFESRKFGSSMLRALFAAVAFAVGYAYSNSIGVMDIAVAFCGGAGVDALGHRISGAISSKEIK